MAKDLRRNLVMKLLLENPEISAEQAMLTVGYSKSYAHNSSLLTKSKSFLAKAEKKLPDDLLLKVHREGLKATTKKPHLIDRDNKGRPIYDYVDEDDHSTRHRFLDTAYKIKDKYAPEKHLVAVSHITQLLDELQNDDETIHKPTKGE